MINLGDKCKDLVTGFTGIAVAKILYLNGCTRWQLQPIGTDKGKLFEQESFDESQLIVLKAKAAKEGKHETGGPRPNLKPEVKIKRF
jgi:hypothetical protein